MADIVSDALSLATGAVQELADELGTSRSTVHFWASGKRKPSPENRTKLAEALRRRGGELARLADELEGAASE